MYTNNVRRLEGRCFRLDGEWWFESKIGTKYKFTDLGSELYKPRIGCDENRRCTVLKSLGVVEFEKFTD